MSGPEPALREPADDRAVLAARAAHPLPAAYVPAPIEPTKKPIGRLVRYASAIADHTVPSAMSTDRPIAVNGLLVNERAAAAGLIRRLKMSRAPTTGTAIVVVSATTSRKTTSMRPLPTPRASATSGITDENISGRYTSKTAAMQTTPITAIGMSSLLLTPSTSPKSSEIDLRRVFGGHRQEERSQTEHHDDHERGGDVMAGAPPEAGDGQRAEHREHREPDDRVDADEACARRSGKGAVGQRVRGERGTAQDDEEPDHAGDDGNDRRRFPGVEHEAREHQPACVAVDARATATERARNRSCEARYARKISVTTKKLTGQPPPLGNQ